MQKKNKTSYVSRETFLLEAKKLRVKTKLKQDRIIPLFYLSEIGVSLRINLVTFLGSARLKKLVSTYTRVKKDVSRLL